ncbi:MAG: recombination-associated protein RdgC [Desulfobacterales bacterium]|nr:recombination-associated protein RdgC [Desulfobacterales bacterium]
MSILSSSVSITRYRVDGQIEESVVDVVEEGLRKNSITHGEEEPSDKIVGWTTFEKPFSPNFDRSSFVIGSYFIFSLRIDKKTIPSKIFKKEYSIEVAKQLEESGREFLARNEKKAIREQVTNVLSLRIPSTPYIYDVLWIYEESLLWFFSTQQSANEELETLFLKSFKLHLIKLFPYTIADRIVSLSDTEKDKLSKLSPIKLVE